MKRLVLAAMLVSGSVASCGEPVKIGKNLLTKPRASMTCVRQIHVQSGAIRDALQWCRTSGGLKYIAIDPNKGWLYRYVCRKPKQTTDLGYENK